ncbi:hypothetical protein HAX54_033455 [Datura stramonium]|uniref:Uncharacterized protein n=1 Tax=Datura stramonium TaxID=4076 RepID=A0ABS8VDI0_DATST|nr:hypothetical protein [Datura stramonium]
MKREREEITLINPKEEEETATRKLRASAESSASSSSISTSVFGAVLGKAPVLKSQLGLFGGWLAMAITYGLTKLIGSSGL